MADQTDEKSTGSFNARGEEIVQGHGYIRASRSGDTGGLPLVGAVSDEQVEEADEAEEASRRRALEAGDVISDC